MSLIQSDKSLIRTTTIKTGLSGQEGALSRRIHSYVIYTIGFLLSPDLNFALVLEYRLPWILSEPAHAADFEPMRPYNCVIVH